MEIADELTCMFSAQIDEQGGSYVIEVPEQEVLVGDVTSGDTYRVAVLATNTSDRTDQEPDQSRERSGPPVEEGERRTVDIEDIGDQGDGIARVERGYVVIVPETEQGERVTIELKDVRENVAFAEVVEREEYFE